MRFFFNEIRYDATVVRYKSKLFIAVATGASGPVSKKLFTVVINSTGLKASVFLIVCYFYELVKHIAELITTINSFMIQTPGPVQ
jgi:hypothetical protein